MEDLTNRDEELIVLYKSDKSRRKEKKIKYNEFIRFLTFILVISICCLFILTLKNNFNDYWIYLINFLVLPSFSIILLLICDKQGYNPLILMLIIILYILFISLITYEAISEYNGSSIFLFTFRFIRI